MCESEQEKFRQAERMAKNKLCYNKCFCPKLRAQNACDNCAVFASLREYYLTSVIGVEPLDYLRRWSWEDIATVAESGKAEELFSLGDEKNLILTNGEEVTVVIIGFNHDELAEGGKAGITFALKDTLQEELYMNEERSNVGGWRASKMRTEYLERIFELLPQELRGRIKPVIKKTGMGGRSLDVEQTLDKLFLFSGNEVEGKEEYSDCGLGGFYGPEDFTAPDEGKQYPYFVDYKNHIVFRNGERESWWLRSPHSEDDFGFCYIYMGAELDCTSAKQKNGVRFGFCI